MARRSGIVGLTDTIQPSLPNLGSIKKGELTPAGNPTKLDHFKFVPVGKAEGEISPLESLFLDTYGTKPTALFGMFIGQNEEDVLWTGMRAAGKKGKTMRLCDRQTCYSRTIQKGQDWVNERGAFECGFDTKTNTCKFKCKAEGRLSFILMTPDGSEPLFVNPVGYPIGTVSHKLSKTDLAGQTGFLANLRGATLMAPLMGMVVKLSLAGWQSQFGTVYATKFLFAGIYAPFQRPALAAPTAPITDIPADLDDEDGLDNFGVDESEVEHPDIGIPPAPSKRPADETQYGWAWKTYCLLTEELDWILAEKVDYKRLPHTVDAACKTFANQAVRFNDDEWVSQIWLPFVHHISMNDQDAMDIVNRDIPPSEMNLLVYRRHLLSVIVVQ